KSKYFRDYMPFFADILPEAYSRHKDLASFNVYLIEKVCQLLEIELHFQSCSSFNFRKHQKFERIKNVLKNCGAHLYISGVGALAYNEEEYFREQGIVCKYMNILDFLREKDVDMGFDPTMSIID